MNALEAYHAGEIQPIIECLVNALELALILGARISNDVSALLEQWEKRTNDRAGSASHCLPALLIAQPVVNVTYVADGLNISQRAARSLIETACERNILSKIGNAKRGSFYQASELLAILEEASSIQGIRRLAAR